MPLYVILVSDLLQLLIAYVARDHQIGITRIGPLMDVLNRPIYCCLYNMYAN